jgi:hypothetical protein
MADSCNGATNSRGEAISGLHADDAGTTPDNSAVEVDRGGRLRHIHSSMMTTIWVDIICQVLDLSMI